MRKTLLSPLVLAACASSQKPAVQPRPDEAHLAEVRRLTHGGQNAEAYWSFDGTQLSFQVSGKAVADGLTKVHQASLAFAPFFDGEVAPLLRAGRLPPEALPRRRAAAGGVVEAVGVARRRRRADRADPPPRSRPAPHRQRRIEAVVGACPTRSSRARLRRFERARRGV